MKTIISLKLLFLAIFFVLPTMNMSAQWTPVNNGLPALETVGVVNLRDTLFTAVNNHGLYYSVNSGDNWTAWEHNPELTTTNITKLEGLSTFPTSAGGEFMNIYGPSMLDFYFSQGAGSAFFNYNIPNEDINSWWWEDSNGNRTDFCGTNNGFYYSTDERQTWTQSTGLTGDALIVNAVIYQDESSSEALFACTDDGIYKSTDLGISFTPFRNGIDAGVKVYKQSLLVATSEGMYAYDGDNDLYSEVISGGDFRTFVIDFPNLFAFAFGNGIAKSINFTSTAINDITQTNITGGVINSTTYVGNYLFICTDNGGVFRIERASVLGTDNNIIDGFALYPNPAADIVNVSANEQIKYIEVFNLMGQRVVNKYANSDKTTINLTQLPQGIYFAKVSTEKTSKSVKLIKR